jgi:hypothetical protein
MAFQQNHESTTPRADIEGDKNKTDKGGKNFKKPDQGKRGKQAAPRENPAAQTLAKVRALLDAGRAQEAFDLLNARESGDPLLKNARGVCLLRLGLPDLAVRVFRQLCLASGGFMLREDAPTAFKTNYAAALLLSGRPSGCLDVLDEIKDEADPAVRQLRAALAEWEKSLSLWRRVMWRCGVEPKEPVRLDPQACGELLDFAASSGDPAA